MSETRDLEEFINELNERVWAIEVMQQMIVAVLAGRSEQDMELLKDGVESYIKDLPAEFQRPKLLSMLNRYLELIIGPQKKFGKPDLKLYRSDRD